MQDAQSGYMIGLAFQLWLVVVVLSLKNFLREKEISNYDKHQSLYQ